MGQVLTDDLRFEKQDARNRTIELYLWLILGFLVSGRFWLTMLSIGRFFPEMLRDFYLDILVGFLCIIFPILYRLVFRLLPLQHLRWARITAPVRSAGPESIAREVLQHVPATPQAVSMSALRLPKDADSETILTLLTQSSRTLSDLIFTRAGIYLIVGVLIAFSGLLCFYTQTAALRDVASASPPESSALTVAAKQISALVPRFGILFFIEFIAFFFLRQYRFAMEEFRYFEAILRKREETFVLVKLTKEAGGDMTISELLKADAFFSTVGKLAAGESTELLESRKLSKDEMDLLSKIIEAVSKSKRLFEKFKLP